MKMASGERKDILLIIGETIGDEQLLFCICSARLRLEEEAIAVATGMQSTQLASSRATLSVRGEVGGSPPMYMYLHTRVYADPSVNLFTFT